jgi:hypothetical protein
MHRPLRINKAALFIAALLFLASTASAQGDASRKEKHLNSPAPLSRPRLTKAVVVDDRLSALRREADIKSQVINRLRPGRPVFIIESKGGLNDRPRFYRVAVTRRTRGWIHESALAIPGRPHEDERLMKLIIDARDGLDRIALCMLLLKHFNRSSLAPRALLALAKEADRASLTLTQHARKRLKDLDESGSRNLRDYYLSDSGLDRYSKLGIAFDYKPAAPEFVYDGSAYREILKRFPHSREAQLARERLDPVAHQQ